jgi:hypothetical protein
MKRSATLASTTIVGGDVLASFCVGRYESRP